MIYGVGLDLVEIARIMDTVQRQPRFPERILSEQELERYHNYTTERRRIEFLAGRFAVKEAFSKALGTGIGKEITFKQIHCENDARGKPMIQMAGYHVHVSITHTEHYAADTSDFRTIMDEYRKRKDDNHVRKILSHHHDESEFRCDYRELLCINEITTE